ncbi:MAG: cysteine desulfurase family protein [Candidatus Paceibacterota bacterium]
MNMFSFFTPKQERVYLDNAGATPLSARSQTALTESLSLYGNPSGIHKEGTQAGLLLDKARVLCANVLNAHAYEIYFVGTGTESCNLAVLGTYEGYKKQEVRSMEQETPDEERRTKNELPHVIVSTIEHPAVLEPIRKLEREKKIRVTYLPVYENGIVKVKDIRDVLCEETILVSVMYANNEIGTIQPVKEIGRALEEWKKEQNRTHTAYPYFHIDACQAANYCNLDVVRLRAHLMTVNSSKVYGPKGVALLYKREGVKIEALTHGGGQERALRSGTESAPLAYAFGVALKESHDMKEVESVRLRMLRDACKKELQQALPDITFYGAWDEGRLQTTDDRQQKSPTTHEERRTKNEFRLPNNINCRVPGISSEEMILRLDAKGFAVSHKSACASSETDGSYVVQALGASEEESLENVRITLGRATSMQDLHRLVEAMKEIVIKYRK